METSRDLVVDSVTGVDVALPVAGPGVRSFAFLIDWHIRTILALAWYTVAAVLYNRGWHISAPLSPGAAWFVFVILPPAAIYFFYHPGLETASRGTTPGKRMAGVRIVDRHGGAPGVGALLTRNVFRLIDSFPIAYAAGLLTTMVTRNHVRIGDLAAGTLLVYVTTGSLLPQYTALSAEPGRMDATSVEVASELLHRWPTLDADARRRIAHMILGSPESAASDDAALREQLQRLAAGGTR